MSEFFHGSSVIPERDYFLLIRPKLQNIELARVPYWEDISHIQLKTQVRIRTLYNRSMWLYKITAAGHKWNDYWFDWWLTCACADV